MAYLQDLNYEASLVDKLKVIPLDRIKKSITRGRKGANAPAIRILQAVGIDAIADLISEGAMAAQIARSLKISPNIMSMYLSTHERYDEVIPQAYEAAADLYVALASQELEDAELEKDSIARAKARAEHYMKLAAHFDRNRFTTGNKPDVSGGGVTYNIVLGDAASARVINPLVEVPALAFDDIAL